MPDLTSPRIMYLKAALFILIGLLAAATLLLQNPTLKTAALIALVALVVWAFARAYYFALYVIQHYIDSDYKYAGLIDLARYLLRKRNPTAGSSYDNTRTD